MNVIVNYIKPKLACLQRSSFTKPHYTYTNSVTCFWYYEISPWYYHHYHTFLLQYENVAPQQNENSPAEELTLKTECQDQKGKKQNQTRTRQERKLKNTFGWTRIDVVTMLICCVFLASLCFSIYVEALQTLVHIDHQDAMHQPVSVLCIGAAGLLLNGLCYLLIGGFTFHQGSFLYVTESGDVVLNKVVVNGKSKQIIPSRKRQGLWEMTRDVFGALMVIVCSLTVIFIEPSLAKFVDPAIALVSSTAIMFLSYPYSKFVYPMQNFSIEQYSS